MRIVSIRLDSTGLDICLSSLDCSAQMAPKGKAKARARAKGKPKGLVRRGPRRVVIWSWQIHVDFVPVPEQGMAGHLIVSPLYRSRGKARRELERKKLEIYERFPPPHRVRIKWGRRNQLPTCSSRSAPSSPSASSSSSVRPVPEEVD